MDDAIRKAEALIEALGYIRRFRGCLTVIKLGGSAMEDPAALHATLQDVVFMETVGLRPVLVHGGGKPIDRAMAAAGLDAAEGAGPPLHRRRHARHRRARPARRDQRRHRRADPRARRPGRRPALRHASSTVRREADAARATTANRSTSGRVGQVTRVDADLIEGLHRAGVVPVIPSLALDAAGGWLNVNADTAAAAVAAHLKAEKLVFLTDTPGILRDRRDPASTVPHLDAAGCRDLIAAGVIDSGMIPKVEACLDSLRAGVRQDAHHRRPAAALAAAGDLHRPRRRDGDRAVEPLAAEQATTMTQSHEQVSLTTSRYRPVQQYVIGNYTPLPGVPGARRRLVGLGRRGQPLPRLLPRLGLRPARATARRGSSRPCRSRSAELIHVPNTWYTEPQGCWPRR